MIDAIGSTAGATLIPMVMNAQIIAAKNDAIWVRGALVIHNSFSKMGWLRGVDDQATKAESGATAGATLMPMVMNAQITAAKSDVI
jgi:hypothetical protein